MTKIGFAGAAVLMVLSGFSSSARADGNDWPMYNYDAVGSRNNGSESVLNLWTVPRLRQVWKTTTAAPVTGTPIVVAGKVFAGDWSGAFYRLNATNGHIDWTAHAVAPVSASALVVSDKVVFGDQAGFIYGLDKTTGAVKWQIQPNNHPFAAIFASPTPVGSYVALGVASTEEDAAADPSYACCSFRGSVVLLDPTNGHVVWHTYLITAAERALGASGAAVWSSVTYDEDSDLLYVTTGNNYSNPATLKSDAIIALDARTGAIRWSSQQIPNDVSNFTYPIEPDKDSDFGDSAQIYRLSNGRKVVGAGDKNGIYFVLDAATGQKINENQVQTGGSLGGLFADSAVSCGVIFANGADWADPFDFSVLPHEGLLTALSGDAQHVLWQKHTPNSVNLGGVSVANSVVYFASCNPGVGDRLSGDPGTLYAVNALTGATLAAKPLDHCSTSGPAISNGKVFVGVGNEFLFAGSPAGSIVSFGL